MSESKHHAKLVMAIKKWIQKHRTEENFSILTDTFGTDKNKRSFNINGYIPDVYAKNFKSPSKIILGEAKTSRDIERKHSELQLKAFLEFCNANDNYCLILAVPWDYTRYTHSFLQEIKRESGLSNVQTIIINELGY